MNRIGRASAWRITPPTIVLAVLAFFGEPTSAQDTRPILPGDERRRALQEELAPPHLATIADDEVAASVSDPDSSLAILAARVLELRMTNIYKPLEGMWCGTCMMEVSPGIERQARRLAEHSMPALTRRLSDADPMVVVACLNSLRAHRGSAAMAEESVIGLIESKNDAIAAAAFRALRYIDWGIGDSDESVRSIALGSLSGAGSDKRRAILELLERTHLGDRDHLDGIVLCLRDADPTTRLLAATRLRSVYRSLHEHFAVIESAFLEETDVSVLPRMVDLVVSRGIGSAATHRKLVALSSHADKEVALAASEAMIEISDLDATSWLEIMSVLETRATATSAAEAPIDARLAPTILERLEVFQSARDHLAALRLAKRCGIASNRVREAAARGIRSIRSGNSLAAAVVLAFDADPEMANAVVGAIRQAFLELPDADRVRAAAALRPLGNSLAPLAEPLWSTWKDVVLLGQFEGNRRSLLDCLMVPDVEARPPLRSMLEAYDSATPKVRRELLRVVVDTAPSDSEVRTRLAAAITSVSDDLAVEALRIVATLPPSEEFCDVLGTQLVHTDPSRRETAARLLIECGRWTDAVLSALTVRACLDLSEGSVRRLVSGPEFRPLVRRLVRSAVERRRQESPWLSTDVDFALRLAASAELSSVEELEHLAALSAPAITGPYREALCFLGTSNRHTKRVVDECVATLRRDDVMSQLIALVLLADHLEDDRSILAPVVDFAETWAQRAKPSLLDVGVRPILDVSALGSRLLQLLTPIADSGPDGLRLRAIKRTLRGDRLEPSSDAMWLQARWTPVEVAVDATLRSVVKCLAEDGASDDELATASAEVGTPLVVEFARNGSFDELPSRVRVSLKQAENDRILASVASLHCDFLGTVALGDVAIRKAQLAVDSLDAMRGGSLSLRLTVDTARSRFVAFGVARIVPRRGTDSAPKEKE